MSRVFHLSRCHQMRVLLTGSSPLLRCQSLPTDTSFGCFVTSHGFSVFILRLPKSEAYRVEPSIPKPSIPYPFFHIHSLPSLSLFTIAIHSQCQFQSYSYHGITVRNILTSLTYTIPFPIDFFPWLFDHFTTGFLSDRRGSLRKGLRMSKASSSPE